MIKLDHLMYAVPDLELGMQQIHELTGIKPVMGGSHPGVGTRNALLSFSADQYLEIIAQSGARFGGNNWRVIGAESEQWPSGLGSGERRLSGYSRHGNTTKRSSARDRRYGTHHPGWYGAGLETVVSAWVPLAILYRLASVAPSGVDCAPRCRLLTLS